MCVYELRVSCCGSAVMTGDKTRDDVIVIIVGVVSLAEKRQARTANQTAQRALRMNKIRTKRCSHLIAIVRRKLAELKFNKVERTRASVGPRNQTQLHLVDTSIYSVRRRTAVWLCILYKGASFPMRASRTHRRVKGSGSQYNIRHSEPVETICHCFKAPGFGARSCAHGASERAAIREPLGGSKRSAALNWQSLRTVRRTQTRVAKQQAGGWHDVRTQMKSVAFELNVVQVRLNIFVRVSV